MGNKNKPQRFEGFWWSEREPHFPKPVSSDVEFEGKAEVVAALEKLEKSIYLHKAPSGRCVYFKGWSNCRCCGQRTVLWSSLTRTGSGRMVYPITSKFIT